MVTSQLLLNSLLLLKLFENNASPYFNFEFACACLLCELKIAVS